MTINSRWPKLRSDPVFRATEADTCACQVWREFRDDMDNYIIAAGPEKADGPRKVSILLYSMGTRYRKIFASFTFAEDNDRKDYDKVTKKFDEYFEPKKLTKLYMKKFNACVQKPTKTVSEYTNL